jgi:dihydrofolate reductase
MSDFMKRIDSLFIGRKTYELTLNMEGGTGFSHLKEYVFSNSIDQVRKGSILINGNIKGKIIEIKNQPGKDIWLFGGAELTSSLMNLALVDEVWLSIHPIILGGGKPLFKNIKSRIQLKLIDTKTYSTGLVSCHYLIHH